MGVSIAWLGVKGLKREDTLAFLGLEPGDEKYDFLPARPAPSYTDQMGKSHWHIIIALGSDDRLISTDLVEELSARADVITCSIEEHVMFVEASYWKRGQQVWKLSHQGDTDPDGMESEGELPAKYKEHLSWARRMLDQDPDPADYMFEVVTRLAKEYTGFKHDENLELYDEEGYSVLKIQARSRLQQKPHRNKRRWWAFWRN